MKVVSKLLWLLWLVPTIAAGQESPTSLRDDEKLLEQHRIGTDAKSLIEFFRHRSLSPKDRLEVEAWIEQLGANSYRVRQIATEKLIERGPAVQGLLQKALEGEPDLEVQTRAEECLRKIRSRDLPQSVLPAAVRVLRARKAKETVEVLLSYLPFAANPDAVEEVRTTLRTLAVQDGKVHPTLLAALKNRDAIVRAAAAEALARVGDAEVRKLVLARLKDVSPLVRMRTASGLILAGDKSAVAVLIDTIPHLDYLHAFEAEGLLQRIAGNLEIPQASVRDDREALNQCAKLWSRWWKENQNRVDLSKISDRPRLRGWTVVVLLDEGKVMELDRSNRVRWQVTGISFPLDIQMLPGERFLVAEYHASQVTERDLTGKILWRYRVVGPLVAQRLPNGNTFIGTDSMMFEVTRSGQRVYTFEFPDGVRIRKSAKLRDGNIVCLRDDSRVVVVNPKSGKILRSFPVSLAKPLFGGKIHMLRNGNVLVPHNAENEVREYDRNGNVVWRVAVNGPIAAVRLPNGNTLVTTMFDNRAVEFDRQGRQVWEFRAKTRVTRAIRR